MARSLLIRDFSGGIRKNADTCAENESADIQGAWHNAGGLQAMKGVSRVTLSGTATDTWDQQLIDSHAVYNAPHGMTYLLAKKERGVWVGIPRVEYDRPIDHADRSTSHCIGLFDMRDTTDAIFNHRVKTIEYLTNYGTQPVMTWSDRVRDFDGQGAHMRTSSTSYANFTTDAQLSIALWLKVRTAPASGVNTIIAKRDTTASCKGWALDLEPDRQLRFYAGSAWSGGTGGTYTQVSTTSALDLDTWYFVHVTYDDTGAAPVVTFHVAKASETNTSVWATSTTAVAAHGTSLDTTATLCIGTQQYSDYYSGTAWLRPFDGWMGTVSIHDDLATNYEAMFDAEKGRYGDPTEVTYSWYPLHLSSHDVDGPEWATWSTPSTKTTYLPPRCDGRGSFAQVGYNVYFSSDDPNTYDNLLVWRSMTLTDRAVICYKGRVKGYQKRLVGTAIHKMARFEIDPDDTTDIIYPLLQVGLRAGDTIYIKDHSTNLDKWYCAGHVIAAIGPTEDGTSNPVIYVYGEGISTVGKGYGGGDYCDYCIVRVHRAGVEAGGALTAAVTTGGTLTDGKEYSYVYRYENSVSGYVGDISSAAATTARAGTGKRIHLTGWSAQPDGYDVNTFRIYRAAGTASYKEMYSYSTTTYGTMPMLRATGGTYASTGGGTGSRCWRRLDIPTGVTDGGQYTEGDLLDDNCAAHARPGVVRMVRVYNTRLYGVGSNKDGHKLKFSTLDNYEYWPEVLYDYSDIAPSDNTVGGSVPIVSSSSDYLTAMVPEQGTYTSTGRAGTSLLIFTRNNAYRWYGFDWDDFSVEEAFPHGCIAPGSAINAEGVIMWCSGEHVMMLSAGGNVPVIVSRQLWPWGIKREINTTYAPDKMRLLELWNATHWEGNYLLSGSLGNASGYICDTTWMFDMASGTWTSFPAGYTDMLAWDKCGSGDGRVLTGAVPTLRGSAGVQYGDLDKLFAGDPAHTFTYISRPLYMSDEPIDGTKQKHIMRVRASWRAPLTSDHTAYLTLYKDGDLTTAAYGPTAATVTAATNDGERVLTEWSPITAIGRVLQLKLTCAVTKALRLDWIAIEYNLDDH